MSKTARLIMITLAVASLLAIGAFAVMANEAYADPYNVSFDGTVVSVGWADSAEATEWTSLGPGDQIPSEATHLKVTAIPVSGKAFLIDVCGALLPDGCIMAVTGSLCFDVVEAYSVNLAGVTAQYRIGAGVFTDLIGDKFPADAASLKVTAIPVSGKAFLIQAADGLKSDGHIADAADGQSFSAVEAYSVNLTGVTAQYSIDDGATYYDLIGDKFPADADSLKVTAIPVSGKTFLIQAADGLKSDGHIADAADGLSFSAVEAYSVSFDSSTILVKAGEDVIGEGELFPNGIVLTVTAVPKTGYTSELLASVGDIGENGSYTVGTAAVEFTVAYTAIKYTATVDLDGGSIPPDGWALDDGKYTKDFDFGTSYADILDDFGTPTRAGYKFEGFDPATGSMGVGGAVFTAQWAQLTITYMSDGVEVTGSPVFVIYGTAPTPLDAPENVGYTFIGWFEDGADTAFDFESYTAPTDHLTLYAVWGHVVTFHDGTDTTEVLVLDGELVTRPTEDPTDAEMTFVGWFADSELTIPFDFDTEITADTDVYAGWGYVLTVYIDAENIEVGLVLEGTKLDRPTENPTDPEKTFVDWFADSELTIPFDFSVAINANTDVYAGWGYVVTFETYGGSDVDEQIVIVGNLINRPADPTIDGYVFGGWYDADDDVFNFSVAPTGDVTVYAFWAIDISEAAVEDIADQAFTGTGIMPGVVVEDGSYTLELNTDYTVAYSNNINVGTATVIITGIGDYGGTKTVTFAITIDDDGIKDLIGGEDEPAFGIDQGSAADLEIDNTVFQELADAGKTLTVDVTDDEGNVMYSWVFDGEYDEEATGTFRAGISVVEDPDEDLLEAVTSAGAENPFVLNFAASGKLPVNATVKYYVGDKYEPGATLNLFFFNEDTNELEAMDQELVVDANGFVTFSPPHFSLYVLAESIPGPAPDGSADNLMLYVAIGAAILAIIVAAVILRKQ